MKWINIKADADRDPANKTEKPINKLYFVRFFTDKNGFSGWNTVNAESIEDAKEKFFNHLGQDFFDKIDWKTLKIGDEAKKEDEKMEYQYGSLNY